MAAGISYGYQLYVSPRWNVEFTAGFRYLHFEYDKYAFPREMRLSASSATSIGD